MPGTGTMITIRISTTAKLAIHLRERWKMRHHTYVDFFFQRTIFNFFWNGEKIPKSPPHKWLEMRTWTRNTYLSCAVMLNFPIHHHHHILGLNHDYLLYTSSHFIHLSPLLMYITVTTHASATWVGSLIPCTTTQNSYYEMNQVRTSRAPVWKGPLQVSELSRKYLLGSRCEK